MPTLYFGVGVAWNVTLDNSAELGGSFEPLQIVAINLFGTCRS
jgi:hypothetical protein